jgi:FKBP-type peptidyl-prolyl cis-trans isomerase
VVSALSSGCRSRSHPRSQPDSQQAQHGADLKTEDLVVGTGPTAIKGSRVWIHYTGWLGRAMFDNSKNRQPLDFRLGKGEVLRGWDEGIVGMKVGGRRRLTVPPDLGYGMKGSLGGAIPPNSVLVFEIELLDAS